MCYIEQQIKEYVNKAEAFICPCCGDELILDAHEDYIVPVIQCRNCDYVEIGDE